MANFPADGAYQVLATLSQGAESYRIFAELFIEGSNSHLRFHRFGGDRDDTGWEEERRHKKRKLTETKDQVTIQSNISTITIITYFAKL